MKRFSKALAAIMLMTAVLVAIKPMHAQTINGHDYVDLGLPSGTLWATCNVGADTPEGYGDYFAWGETSTKTTYDWDTYKCAMGDSPTILQSSNDAATANWGSEWCMPTETQWRELNDYTTCTWTTQNGVNGVLFTADNGNSLFMPAAGYYWVDQLDLAGTGGYYWANSLDTTYPDHALRFGFSSFIIGVSSHYRNIGLSVRAVCSEPQN